jgi:hypothetical protein
MHLALAARRYKCDDCACGLVATSRVTAWVVECAACRALRCVADLAATSAETGCRCVRCRVVLVCKGPEARTGDQTQVLNFAIRRHVVTCFS